MSEISRIDIGVEETLQPHPVKNYPTLKLQPHPDFWKIPTPQIWFNIENLPSPPYNQGGVHTMITQSFTSKPWKVILLLDAYDME